MLELKSNLRAHQVSNSAILRPSWPAKKEESTRVNSSFFLSFLFSLLSSRPDSGKLTLAELEVEIEVEAESKSKSSKAGSSAQDLPSALLLSLCGHKSRLFVSFSFSFFLSPSLASSSSASTKRLEQPKMSSWSAQTERR